MAEGRAKTVLDVQTDQKPHNVFSELNKSFPEKIRQVTSAGSCATWGSMAAWLEVSEDLITELHPVPGLVLGETGIS